MNQPVSTVTSSRLNIATRYGSALALIAGLAIGALTLVSSLGVWLGVWDFRKGFQLLRWGNENADWVALVCLALTIVILVVTKLTNNQKAVRLTSMAMIGTLAAALAYYIPQSFRAPEGVNYPPIHDVSTDIENPLEYVDILPLRADAPNTVVYGGSRGMTPEKLAQLQTEAYPDLVPRSYESSEQQMFARALAAVDQLGWELVSQVPEEGRIEATATTFWFRFKDDVVIKLDTQGNKTVVNARSLSRVGGGDVGANALRLRAFFELLE